LNRAIAFTRRALLAVVAGLVFTTPAAAAGSDLSLNGETLLWRLDPPGGGAPSYMVGTIHIVDERLQPSIDRALVRLEEAGALVVEVDISDAAQLDVMQAMLLTDGRALPDIIGEDQFARLAEIGAAYQLPAFFLRQLAPWGAALMISVPADQIEKMAAGAPVFDQSLVDAAQLRGLPVETLETVQEQIAAFAGHPEADQVTMLDQALDLHPQLGAMVAEMIDRYLEDDLAGLTAVALREMETGDVGLNQRVLDLLITERNQRMAERVLPLIESRPHLVAIGAMHLPGETGVLNLLAERGWTVTPAP
jgi:uncharacterized protein